MCLSIVNSVSIFQENQEKEEEHRKRDMELDYLSPFLAKIGNPQRLTRNDALKVKEECLKDLKQRLIDKANLIQARFEKVTVLIVFLSILHIYDDDPQYI